MRDWQHDRKTDIGLRLCGAAACAVCYFLVTALLDMRLANGRLPDAAFTYILEACAFLGASLGGALLVHGHHIFDEVVISERWRTTFPAKDPAADCTRVADVKNPSDQFPQHVISQDHLRARDSFHRG